jgi:hypothetical protein
MRVHDRDGATVTAPPGGGDEVAAFSRGQARNADGRPLGR